MEQLNVDDLKKACRVCIRIFNKKVMRSIFRNNIDSMLMEVLPIQLTRDDRLPNLICYTCFMNVKKFYNIRTEFVRNEKRIWNVLVRDVQNDANRVDVENIKTIHDDVPLSEYAKNIKVEPILEEFDDDKKIESKPNDFEHVADFDNRSDTSDGKDDAKKPNDDPTKMFDARSLTCNVCHKSYKRFSRLRDHMIDKHAMNPSDMSMRNQLNSSGSFECLKKSCNFVSKSMNGFTRHMDSSHAREFDKLFTCHFCFHKFYTMDHVNLHVTTYHFRGLKIVDAEIACLKCDSVFGDVHELAKHCTDAHAFGKTALVQDLCLYIISQYEGNICKLCDKKVLNLARHNLEHHKIEQTQSLTCQFCVKTFDSRVERRKHVTRVHKKNKICEICGILYHGKKHMATHNGDKTTRDDTKKITCTLCDVKFQYPSGLKTHMKNMHEAKAGVVCPVCKSVMKEMNLKNHMRVVHFKVQRHPCTLCEKVFRRADALQTHFLVHSNERPYPCRHCDQSFRQPRTRRNHEMRHTGERPYACSSCDRRFIQRSALLVHLKTHGGPETFVCNICPKTFVLRRDFDIHNDKYHPLDVKFRQSPARDSMLPGVDRVANPFASFDLINCKVSPRQ